jgi:hypothetical protein
VACSRACCACTFAPRPRSPKISRFRSLKAFGRWPRCKPHRRDRPASEALISRDPVEPTAGPTIRLSPDCQRVKRAVGTVSPLERNVRKRSKNKQTEAGCSNPILPNSIEFYQGFQKHRLAIQRRRTSPLQCSLRKTNTESGFVRGGPRSNSISACWLGGGVRRHVEWLSLSQAG